MGGELQGPASEMPTRCFQRCSPMSKSTSCVQVNIVPMSSNMGEIYLE